MIKKLSSHLGILAILLTLASCSQKNNGASKSTGTPTVESYPIANTKLQNCHFKNPAPTYTYGATITPNPIVCDSGVATAVSLVSASPLPTNMQFSMDQLALTGIASEKMSQIPYQFYVENQSGYVILNLQLTVK